MIYTPSNAQAIVLLAALCSQFTGQDNVACKKRIEACAKRRARVAGVNARKYDRAVFGCKNKIWHPPMSTAWLDTVVLSWTGGLSLTPVFKSEYLGLPEVQAWFKCDTAAFYPADFWKSREELYEECAR